MQRSYFPQRYSSVPDLLVLLLLATVIYGLVSIGSEWRAEFHPVTTINLSGWALPRYTLLSAIRGVVAYFISLGFTLTVGYLAAKSRTAERVLIPLLDILQSIPVLGFLPGLVLALIALFPKTNIGLELSAIIMIFTGQVWNMTFSFYASLKSIPGDFNEASTVIGLNWWNRLKRVELPFSALNLAWNSVMSMAGGWFFLSICEAFTLGSQQFRLPGIGAYMAVAIQEGNTRAMVMGVCAMVLLIVTMDFLIWRPVLSWVRKFRLEDVPGVEPTEPIMRIVIRESKILRWMKLAYRRYFVARLIRLPKPADTRFSASDVGDLTGEIDLSVLYERSLPAKVVVKLRSPIFAKITRGAFVLLFTGIVAWGAWRLFGVLREVPLTMWVIILRNTLWTLARVLLACALSTLWAVPVGIWIGTSARRIQFAQPIIQVLASFPAPMLYPLALAVLFALGVNFEWGSMFLMMAGVQWYVLFNVLAGALRIPQELQYALALMESSRWDRWKALYLPSVFPALVTGWITAAGGAWNASIVAEYIAFRGSLLKTSGIGATISEAAGGGQFAVLAASLTLMVGVVLLVNRFVWGPVYRFAQTRFKMEF